ncbi:MAG: phosphocholine cytidylyltransferase family protein [Candidatus Methanomethylophilaceae archaeon]|nr:phosphocholine cytidylyltransferase family protein [Candidatus Methanomethylophilaceae archaeon]
MRAILLAAGKGTRISRHFKRPKCTLEIDGVPIIEHTVRILKSRGIDVSIVLGYGCEFIREVLKDYDVDYSYNPFYSVTNSLGSLWVGRKHLPDGEDVIIGNADVYWEEPLIDRLLEDRRDMVMVVDRSRYEVGDYFFYVEDGCIKRYGKDLKIGERTHEYVGLAKISACKVSTFAERLESMVKAEKYDLWWENVLYEYIDEDPVYVVDVSDMFWAEVDYIQDYDRIMEYIRTGDVLSKIDKRFAPHSD